MLELFMAIATLIDDVRHAKRFGWGSFLWELASFACLVVTVIFFAVDVIVLGVAGILGSVVCLVVACRRMWRDIRKTRQAENKAE